VVACSLAALLAELWPPPSDRFRFDGKERTFAHLWWKTHDSGADGPFVSVVLVGNVPI
jgi:hypothetical protein